MPLGPGAAPRRCAWRRQLALTRRGRLRKFLRELQGWGGNSPGPPPSRGRTPRQTGWRWRRVVLGPQLHRKPRRIVHTRGGGPPRRSRGRLAGHGAWKAWERTGLAVESGWPGKGVIHHAPSSFVWPPCDWPKPRRRAPASRSTSGQWGNKNLPQESRLDPATRGLAETPVFRFLAVSLGRYCPQDILGAVSKPNRFSVEARGSY